MSVSECVSYRVSETLHHRSKECQANLGIDGLKSDFIAKMWLLGECLCLEGCLATVWDSSYAKLDEIPTDSAGNSIQFDKESS